MVYILVIMSYVVKYMECPIVQDRKLFILTRSIYGISVLLSSKV